MSDLLELSQPQSVLITEIIELRQNKLETQTLKSLTDLYKTQVSDLEVEVSDLKAQVMAKDHEIQSLKFKLHSPPQSNHFSLNLAPSPQYPESPEKAQNVLIRRMQSLLQEEKEKNSKLNQQVKQLQFSLGRSRETLNVQTAEKIEELQFDILRLTEENAYLKGKIRNYDLIEPSTAHKSIDGSEIKMSSVSIDTESASIAESTPRFEGSILDIQESPGFICGFPQDNLSPQKFANPEPPKTRSRSDYPKKVMPGRNIKYVNCNLSEILSSPLKNRQPAEFCPTILRKFM